MTDKPKIPLCPWCKVPVFMDYDERMHGIKIYYLFCDQAHCKVQPRMETGSRNPDEIIQAWENL